MRALLSPAPVRRRELARQEDARKQDNHASKASALQQIAAVGLVAEQSEEVRVTREGTNPDAFRVAGDPGPMTASQIKVLEGLEAVLSAGDVLGAPACRGYITSSTRSSTIVSTKLSRVCEISRSHSIWTTGHCAGDGRGHPRRHAIRLR